MDTSIYRLESGLIFIDDFNSVHSRWLISPVPSYSITERPGFLRLKHNDNVDTIALFDKTEQNMAIQVISDYVPAINGDEGGLLLWKNSDERIEFLEKKDDLITGEQKEWLAECNGNQWDFYSKEDSDFIFRDSSDIEASKVGLVLKKGTNENFVPLDIDKVIVTKSRKITMVNLAPSNKVVLEDGSGNVVSENIVAESETGVEILLPDLEFSGTLKVYDGTDLISELSATFYGGDVYSVGTTLEVRWNGSELDKANMTDIGIMNNGYLEIQLEIYNPATVPATNVKVSIKQYMSEFGYTWADVAKDISGSPSNYQDEIIFDTINAGETIPFWLKVTKGNDYDGFRPLQFQLNVSHD